nr:unnamed protein product [Callosobruchus chinensis]
MKNWLQNAYSGSTQSQTMAIPQQVIWTTSMKY